VREEVGLGWMTPHTWRRTYAIVLDDEITFTDRMKADLMGQAQCSLASAGARPWRSSSSLTPRSTTV
jgi:integrase